MNKSELFQTTYTLGKTLQSCRFNTQSYHVPLEMANVGYPDSSMDFLTYQWATMTVRKLYVRRESGWYYFGYSHDDDGVPHWSSAQNLGFTPTKIGLFHKEWRWPFGCLDRSAIFANFQLGQLA